MVPQGRQSFAANFKRQERNAQKIHRYSVVALKIV